LAWAAVLVFVASTLGAVASSALASEPDSAFVAGGEGADALVEDARILGLAAQRSVAGPLALQHDAAIDPSRTLLVVAGPAKSYTGQEAEALRSFVERGGQVLVADDFGQANSLTSPLGITFERVRLVEGPDASPQAALDGRTYRLGLEKPTGLKLALLASANVLAWSSEGSFLDRDADGVIGAADPHGPFPLMAEVTPPGAAGRVLAVADTGLHGVAGADLAQNRDLRQALLAHALPDGGLVLVDESRSAADPGLTALANAVAAASATPWRYLLFAIAGGLLLGLAAPYLRERWQAHRFRPHRFVRRDSLGARVEPHPPEPHDQPRSHWTPRGSAAILAASVLAIGALLFRSAEAGYAAGALMLAVAMAALPALPRIEASRVLSQDRTDEGTDVEATLRIRQRLGGGAELEFRDHVPEEFEVREGLHWFRASLARGQPVEVRYKARPALRGPYVIGPLHVRREDPLGLHVQERHLAEGTPIRVNPGRESVRKIPFRTRVPSITLGPHLVNRAGDGSEFHALRAYQTGDSYRSVNWKASARSKDLMVNQRVHESMARLTIFLDARAISAAGPASRSPLAHGCRAALSMAAGALRVRDRLHVVVYGPDVYEMPAMPGSRQLHELTELLSGLPAGGDTSFLTAVQQALPSLGNGTPVMLASGLEGDPTIADGMRLLRARGLLPFAIVPPLGLQPIDPADGDAEPGAAALAESRKNAISELQALGVPVFDAVPDVPLDYLFRTGGGL
jgi:uncharacterized protein (DUF58 family)